MQIQDAIQKGKNFFAVGFFVVAGFSFLTDLMAEGEFSARLDEYLLVALALVAVWWYVVGNNKFKHSFVPVFLMILASLIKLLGIFLEWGDTEDLGNDIGGIVFFLVALFIVIWQYFKKEDIAA